jgi:hypothetical protein
MGFGKCTAQTIRLIFSDLFNNCLTQLTHCTADALQGGAAIAQHHIWIATVA